MSRELRTQIDKTIDEKMSLVKEYYGLKNDSEIVRFLIVKEYNEISVKAKLPVTESASCN